MQAILGSVSPNIKDVAAPIERPHKAKRSDDEHEGLYETDPSRFVASTQMFDNCLQVILFEVTERDILIRQRDSDEQLRSSYFSFTHPTPSKIEGYDADPHREQ